MILYGAPVREKIKKRLSEKVEKLGFQPVLAIVMIGDRSDSEIYIKNKIKFGTEIGIKTEIRHFSQEDLVGKGDAEIVEEIKRLNENSEISGIIVQLPLPSGFSTEKILAAISTEKDVDGLSPDSKVLPATARGVLSLLDFYNIPIKDQKVAVIGRSRLAGGPIASALERRGAEVSVCHRSTPNMPEVCRKSDILVSAAGVLGLVTSEFINPNQVIVDVGINRISNQEENFKPKIVGDVCFDEIKDKVKALTPVPGGVGPLTVACLFENLLDLIKV